MPALDSTQPKYAPWVSLLREDAGYLRAAPAPAYWALAPYYVGQFTESACSLASAAMLVNAARAGFLRGARTKLITQSSLLDAVGGELWRAGVENDGGRGVGLLQLRALLAAAFAAHDLAQAAVEAVPLMEPDPETLARFRAVLRAGEAGAGRFVVANYYMAAAIGAGDYGHFSPLGAYDAAGDRVLVLDVYRVEYEPYWLPVERLFAAMAIANRRDGEPRGYLDIRLAA